MNRIIAALLSGCILLAAIASAQRQSGIWTTPSAEQVNAVYPEVESLYLDLHRTPELAMHEQQTAAKLAERVKALGYEVTTGVGSTGIVAVLRNGTGRTVLLRTDMDALPIEEKTALSFASRVVVKAQSSRSVKLATLRVTHWLPLTPWILRSSVGAGTADSHRTPSILS